MAPHQFLSNMDEAGSKLVQGAWARALNTSDDEAAFDLAGKMAQMFSGIMFGALALYLVFSNSTRLSYIQRASLEKRLSVCVSLTCGIAALSAFLNLFQLTELDNFVLVGQTKGKFSVDVARPIEWILTCPLMQLCLVLMGGSRIPESRRLLMPCLAALVLCLGASTLFLEETPTYVVYGIAVCVHCYQMYMNRLQIIEHSNGLEGLLTGDSEFRKATLILMGTWLPFPLWFFLSPEGIGAIENVMIIQVGWAFLNVTAKFSSIFYFQRIKDNYCNRLKVKRSMAATMKNINKDVMEDEDGFGTDGHVSGELGSCVVETLNFLGMAEKAERFIRLLEQAQITTFDQVVSLEKEECATLQLPFDLISALQKRQKVWRLEMVDDNDLTLERGEEHYKIKDNKAKMQRKNSFGAGQGKIVPDGMATPPLAPTGTDAYASAAESMASLEELKRIANGQHDVSSWPSGATMAPSDDGCKSLTPPVVGAPMEAILGLETRILEQFELAMSGVTQKIADVQKSVHAFEQKHVASHQRLEEALLAIDAVGRSNSASIDASHEKLQGTMQSVGEQLGTSQERFDRAMRELIEKSQGTLEAKVELEFAKGPFVKMTEQIIQESKASAFTVQAKLEAFQSAQKTEFQGLEQNMSAKVEEVMHAGVDEVVKQSRSTTEQLQSDIQGSKVASCSEQSKLAQNVTQMIKEMSQESSRNTEVAMGVVSNGLRAQLEMTQNGLKTSLETSQKEHSEQRVETQASLFAKLDSLVTQIKEASQTQADKVNTCVGSTVSKSTEQLNTRMEEAAQHRHERFQDIQTMVAAVLAEACGAKNTAAACADKMGLLNQNFGCMQIEQQQLGNPGLMYSSEAEETQQRLMQGRPGTAGGTSPRRDRGGRSITPPPSGQAFQMQMQNNYSKYT